MKLAATAAAIAIALVAAPASAQSDAPTWALDSKGSEAALAVAGVVALGSYFLPQHNGLWSPSNERLYSFHADAMSWVTFGGATAGVALLSYSSEGRAFDRLGVASPYERALPQLLADGEAFAMTAGITMAIKRVAGRCRPPAAGKICRSGEHDAFPSGHTSPAAAVAMSQFLLAVRSAGTPEERWAAAGLAGSLTLATAGLRIFAGKHSWEDVLVGFFLGSTVGAAIELMHPMVPLDHPRRITPHVYTVGGVF